MTKILCEADTRVGSILNWLRSDLRFDVESIATVSGDASFRRYFRVGMPSETYIVMDAPPERETIEPFIHVAGLLDGAGVSVPDILAVNRTEGFLLLSDMGSRSYLDQLNESTEHRLYDDAIDTLLRFQAQIDIRGCGLPRYDEALLSREITVFFEWFLGKRLGIHLEGKRLVMLSSISKLLIESALEQPCVCVHRDYHSRNLMELDNANPGVLDFQDAVVGPITYDLVSLLRDCYIAWPEVLIEKWVRKFHARLGDLDVSVDYDQFCRWFDLMGVQRHMKAVGIFSRLDSRDGKPGYLADIPRTLAYVRAVCRKYPELSPLDKFLEAEVFSRMGRSMAG